MRPLSPERCVVPVLALVFALCAHSAEPEPAVAGWLEYHDGTRVHGRLLESGDEGGRLDSDRFGELRFAAGEAHFVADAAEPLVQVAGDDGEWTLHATNITLAASRHREPGSSSTDLRSELGLNWQRPQDDIDLRLEAEYGVHNQVHDVNKQSGRLRWFHSLASPWLVTAQGFVERDRVDLPPLGSTDYLLSQLTLGGGTRVDWEEDAWLRLVLGFARFRLDLLDYDDAHAYLTAPGILLDGNVPLTARISFSNWTNLWRWHAGDYGLESETRLDYAITEHVGIGLVYRLKKDAPTVHTDTLDDLELTTRFNF